MANTAYRRSRHKAALVVLIVVMGILTGGCQEQAPTPTEPTPVPSATATLNFADLPPVVATIPIDRTATPVAIVTATPSEADPTPSPPPTASFNLIPTQLDTSWEACEDSPLSNLHVGDRASISYEPYLPTRIRTRPGLHTSSVLGLVIPGEVIEIQEGPACVDQAVWWKVKSLRKNLAGWVQEGDEESRWLIQADQDSAARVPAPTGVPCPVTDDRLCSFVEGLKSPIVQGDIAEILANTLTDECPPVDGATSDPDPSLLAGEELRCAQWGVIGSGLGGLDLTPLALIEPGWSTYAAPPRKLTAIILPPYEGIQPALPQNPALFINTRDPLWDWLFFIEETEGGWQISALMMLSRESESYPILTEDQVLWP